MKKYSCNECRVNETEDLKESGWIEMGGEGSSFFFHSFLPSTGNRSLTNWSPLHFCSKKCFIVHFVKDAEF